MKYINPTLLSKISVENLYSQFNTAKPYKHVVIDNFLHENVADQLNDTFPTYETLNKKYDGLNEKKAEGSNFQDFNPLFQAVKSEISSPEFCRWITSITGIQDVFVTDDALGSGLHQGKTGSFLDIHIDFSMHHIQNVFRRLNLLIYFNKGWKDEWNGHTELWNIDMTVLEKKVKPIFNRVLIFETTGNSYHGYGKINIPENITRKSYYTYFYTKENGDQNQTYNDTVFRARPEESMFKKIQTNIKEQSKNFVKRQFKRFGVKF